MTSSPRPIAVQLYSLRNLTKHDLVGTLQLVADMGYVGVEPDDLFGLTGAQLRALLDGLGLQVCSTHGDIPDGPDADAVLEEHAALGSTAMFASLKPADAASPEAISKAADRFAVGAEAARRHGIRLGFHNHWWEFANQWDGAPAYDHFLAALVERNVPLLLELDLYWIEVGGADPAERLRQLGPAAPYVHVKDGPATPGDPMTALGAGTLDLERILEAGSDVQWHIVELDECATDMTQAFRDSYGYLVDGGWSRGRSTT